LRARDSADDAIISKTLSGVVQTWNAGAEQLYGYSASEMIGVVAVLLPPDRPDEENIIIDRLSGVGQSLRYDPPAQNDVWSRIAGHIAIARAEA
jgi:PAS domain S-box-containing protein